MHRYLEKNPLYIEQILDIIGIEWKTNEYGYVIDDLYGTGYIANIYQDSAVYKDIREINVKRFSDVLKELYPEILIELTKDMNVDKSDSIRETFNNSKSEISKPKSVTKPTTELDEININIDIGKALLIAQTGSGKTRFIKEQVLKRRKKVIMLEPLSVQVAQEEQAYRRERWPVKAAFLYMDSETKDLKNANLIFATYDQIEKIQEKVNMDEYILVIDEAHELILALRYRYKALKQLWNVLKRRKQYLLMTATNYNLYLERFVDHVYKLKCRKKQNRYYTFAESKKSKPIETLVTNVIEIYKSEISKPKSEILNTNTKQLIYIDSKDKLFKLRKTLIEHGINTNDITIITSDNKDNARTIIEEYKLEKKITLTTRVLSAGFHLFNEGTIYYHMIPSEPNIMIQELNRVREYSDVKQLNNTVYAIIYVKPYKKQRKITINHWIRDYKSLTNFEYNAKQLLDKYKKQRKTISHLTDRAYYNLLFNDAWKHLIIHDKYNRYYVNSKELLSEILNNEGFQYIDLNSIGLQEVAHTELIDEETVTEEELIDMFNDYRKMIESMEYKEAKEQLDKLKGINKALFGLALRIHNYRHVIEGKRGYEQKLENWIKQKKFRNANDSLTKMIDKYAIENLDKISGKDRAIIEVKFKGVFEDLKKVLNETTMRYNKDDIYNIKTMYKIDNKHWNAILKRIGLKYNDKIKKYTVVDKRRLLQFLDKEQEYITVNDTLKQVLSVNKTTYSKEELYKIKEEFGISKHKWSNLLKEIGLKYRATKKQYKVVDMDKFKVFLENNEVEIETEIEQNNNDIVADYEIFEVNEPIPINRLRDKITDLRRKAKKKILLRFNDMRYLVQLLNKYNKYIVDSLADKVEYPELTDNIQKDMSNLNLTVDEVLTLMRKLMG